MFYLENKIKKNDTHFINLTYLQNIKLNWNKSNNDISNHHNTAHQYEKSLNRPEN